MLKMLAFAGGAVLCLAATPTAAKEPKMAKPSQAQRLQSQAMQDVPRCTRKLGTLSIANGDDPSGWTQANLDPPQKLLRVLVQRSGCFNLVDRATGLKAAQNERDINGDLGLQRGSNVGKGQVRAADYVLVAEVQASDQNSGGGGVGGAVGGLLGGRIGGLLGGGVKSRKLEANTILSLTNVRTTETLALEDGYAAKNDVSFLAGGAGFLGGAVAGVGGGYEDTEVGRMVTLAFIDAYTKMVSGLGLVSPGAAGTAESAPQKSFSAQAPVALRTAANASGKILRTLPVGAVVYPTGNKNGLWWEVADENDNVGWVLNTKLGPAEPPVTVIRR